MRRNIILYHAVEPGESCVFGVVDDNVLKRGVNTDLFLHALLAGGGELRDGDEHRTHKVFHALEEVCYVFDLGKPIWLEHNIDEFKRHAKARFYQDSFIEQIDFDFLEIQVIEED